MHAQGQVASFKADLRWQKDELQRAFNAVLPDDVRVFSLRKAPPDFNARIMAQSKVYRYRIFNARRVSPFLIRYVLHWPGPLDIAKISVAARLFVREADFTAFSSNRLLHPVRRVLRSEIQKKGNEIVYTIEANGFLRYMVRTIIGTLIEVGREKIEPRQIEEIFRQNRRSLAGPTAPAGGYAWSGNLLIQTQLFALRCHCERALRAKQCIYFEWRLLRHFVPHNNSLLIAYVLVGWRSSRRSG